MNFFRTFRRTRRRLRRKATRYSLLVVVVLFGLFLEAYMHNFNLVYITLFFIFAAAFAAGPLGMMNLGRLDAAFDGCGRLFARRQGTCRLRITNPAPSAAWGVEACLGERRIRLPKIAPGETRRAVFEIVPEKRGKTVLGDCRLESLFPLSTVRFVLPVSDRCEAIAYPEPRGEPLRSFLRRRHAPFGDELDFDGIVRADTAVNASRTHWPSVAKGEPAVKVFRHEYVGGTLRFDFFDSGTHDEARLSQLTLWVLECERERREFEIVLPSHTIDSRRETIDAILTRLALY